MTALTTWLKVKPASAACLFASSLYRRICKASRRVCIRCMHARRSSLPGLRAEPPRPRRIQSFVSRSLAFELAELNFRFRTETGSPTDDLLRRELGIHSALRLFSICCCSDVNSSLVSQVPSIFRGGAGGTCPMIRESRCCFCRRSMALLII